MYAVERTRSNICPESRGKSRSPRAAGRHRGTSPPGADLIRRGGIGGKLNVKRASLPLLALHPNAAAVPVDDELAKGKTEPRAPRARRARHLDLSELPKDQIVVLRRNSGSVVG